MFPGVKAANLNPLSLLIMLSDAYCQRAKFNVADKRLTLAVKFNYWCKWREKGNNTERRMTLDVDNLYLIDCHCSAVSVIHSVTLCYGSMWDCSVIITMMHQLNWAELNYFSLNWETNTSITATVNYEYVTEANNISDCPVCWLMPQPEGDCVTKMLTYKPSLYPHSFFLDGMLGNEMKFVDM